KTYMHLMRAANALFEEPELSRLAPRPRQSPPVATGGLGARDPLIHHESIAYGWLAQGGKRSRPFITLAAYDALKGAPGTRAAPRRPPPRGGGPPRPPPRHRPAQGAFPQGAAGPPRHGGRPPLPLRPETPPPPVRRAGRHQRRRLPARPRLPPGQPRARRP